MSFKIINQQDMMDCGAACLAMVCKHYGKDIPLATVRNQTQLGKQGVSILGISEAAENYGFKTLAVQLSYEQLTEDATLPCILHWSQEHFVVLTKVNKKSFFRRHENLEIADPADGLITLDTETFKKSWCSSMLDGQPTGIALLLEPTQSFYKNNSSVATGKTELGLKTILQYLIKYKSLVIQLLISIAIASFFQVLLPFLTQSIVDTGIQNNNLNFVYVVLIAQIALFCGKLTVDFIRSWILLHISTRINVSILTDFLIKLMKLPISFFDSKQTGDILQRMSDHQRIENFLTGSSLNVLFSFISLILFSGVLAFYNGLVFAVFLLSSLLYVAWIAIFLQKRRHLDYKKFSVAANEQGTKIQMIQGMQEIKLQDCARQVRWKWEKIQAKLFRLNVKSLSLEQWQQSGALFINEGKNILITFFCAKAVIDNEITLGTMLAVQYIIGQLNGPVEQMIGFVQGWQNAKISMARLNEIHHEEDEEPRQKNYLKKIPLLSAKQLVGGKNISKDHSEIIEPPLPSVKLPDDVEKFSTKTSFPHILLNNITFTYAGAGNDPVLEGISMTIPAGKTTAIVGASGSGKTTLLKLLLKFYEPQQGEITLGETPFSILSHQAWRRHCGVVMQDSYIFSDTIAKNISVGNDTVDMNRLRYAVKVANIQDFIEGLPLGFNTKIGSEGNGISMGQRQRILIARAVYKNPDYIFLDEATNSLDANNESVIIDNLEKFFKNKTVIVVAHRLSTVKHADQIILLDNGKIAERGTHEELVNLRKKYYTLVKNQLDLGE
jgi:ATP-binding cassette subfamily B protein